MLDNLRDQPDAAIFEESDEDKKAKAAPIRSMEKPKKVRVHRTFDQVTGMNAFQRFTLVVMLFMTICLLGFMLLILTGKIYLPFIH
jgi:hypothetical protein